MSKLDRILCTEGSENDIELTLAAFHECTLANPIDVVHDGPKALDYLFYRGATAIALGKDLGYFGAIVNTSPNRL